MATLPALVVDAEDQCFFAECLLEVFGELEVNELVAAGLVGFGCAEEAGAVDDSLRTGFEKGSSVFGGFEAAAYLTGQALADHFNEAAVLALAHGGVEVDQLDDGGTLRSVRSSIRSRRRRV